MPLSLGQQKDTTAISFANTDIEISQECFNHFEAKTNHIALPGKFTFPFYYTPHPLSVLAAESLQLRLCQNPISEHNFGLDPEQKGKPIGKMFGILVVQKNDTLGYIAAFSGKIANSNHHQGFVPPIFDTLDPSGFFLQGSELLNALNTEIENLQKTPNLLKALDELNKEMNSASKDLEQLKSFIKEAKKERHQTRKNINASNTAQEIDRLKSQHKLESLEHQNELKYRNKYWKIRTFYKQLEVNVYQSSIDDNKRKRKIKSSEIQDQLFEKYNFLNQKGQTKNVVDIFKNTVLQHPPAGAGECAAPKLLQYAFQHKLKPIAMAEFWWGASPSSEIRKHKHYYPACRGKCEPILSHMLEGIPLDPNPMLVNPGLGKKLETLFEDDHIVVINKPAEFLSVPGKVIEDSVWLRMKQKYPKATGPLVVHRLDMSTSGIILIAKSKEIHKKLQGQFIRRSVQKTYVAILQGLVIENEGVINLPLRLDYNNRPQQMVCEQSGKSAKTKWQKIGIENNRTRVQFHPITGRTHQLRVHAAHKKGLNTPIVGDDLYGLKSDRLYLHAESITFQHPISNDQVTYKAPTPF